MGALQWLGYQAWKNDAPNLASHALLVAFSLHPERGEHKMLIQTSITSSGEIKINQSKFNSNNTNNLNIENKLIEIYYQ